MSSEESDFFDAGRRKAPIFSPAHSAAGVHAGVHDILTRAWGMARGLWAGGEASGSAPLSRSFSIFCRCTCTKGMPYQRNLGPDGQANPTCEEQGVKSDQLLLKGIQPPSILAFFVYRMFLHWLETNSFVEFACFGIGSIEGTSPAHGHDLKDACPSPPSFLLCRSYQFSACSFSMHGRIYAKLTNARYAVFR